VAYFLQIPSTTKLTKIRQIKVIKKLSKISYVFVEKAHDVILKLNIGVGRQPRLLKESGYATVPAS